MTESEVEHGLKLLGWRFTNKLTTEDICSIEPIAIKANELETKGQLTIETIEQLSLDAYKILAFQTIGVEEQADSISTTYIHSPHLKPLIALIDEATLAFYRGYHTSALALLFVILESYLRSVHKWKPGDEDPKMGVLRDSVLQLPDTIHASEAHGILMIIYARYTASLPPSFGFNRHGLLHGMRKSNKYDEMNCARIFQLLDLLCSAEQIHRTGWGECLRMSSDRYYIYSGCLKTSAEQNLLAVDYQNT